MLATATEDGFFRDLTPGWERLLGWSLDELRARPYIELVHPEDREATLAEARRLFEGQAGARFENRYLCKDGSSRWLQWSAFVDMSEPPEERLLHGTAAEVTDHVEARRELERALQEAHGFRSLLDATSDFVGMADLAGITTYVNPPGLRMVGREEEDVRGKPIPHFHTRSHAERLGREAIPHTLEHGIWSDEGDLLRVDGTVIPTTQVIVPLRDAAGRVCALGTIVRDISGSKELEAELRDQKDRLAAALQAMSTPLIPITREIVVMPLIGQMDAERADRVMEVALGGVQASGAQVVILDVTGLAVVDSRVAAALVR
ncbi:MAG: PAS domain S-box protein, partial [Gemmatimonadaceae bacterium]|nr:PAS domain S-box protein [Gemmatimonadaceae bacterium]